MNEIQQDFGTKLLTAFAGAQSADEFCKQVVHKVLRGYEAVGALIALVDNESKCRLIGKFGSWNVNSGQDLNIWTSTPEATSIRSGSPVHINTLDDLRKRFPDATLLLNTASSYSYAPFESTSRAVGFFAVGFANPNTPMQVAMKELQMTTLAAEYISLSVRRVLSEANSSNTRATSIASMPESRELTDRQIKILQLIADGKTNIQIGRALNLSESSIKQEAVRIFRMLGVANRFEAMDIGKRLGLV